MSDQPDPVLVDFVKALARANAARDIAKAREGTLHGQVSEPARKICR